MLDVETFVPIVKLVDAPWMTRSMNDGSPGSVVQVKAVSPSVVMADVLTGLGSFIMRARAEESNRKKVTKLGTCRAWWYMMASYKLRNGRETPLYAGIWLHIVRLDHYHLFQLPVGNIVHKDKNIMSSAQVLCGACLYYYFVWAELGLLLPTWAVADCGGCGLQGPTSVT